jgi:hypothetical protein
MIKQSITPQDVVDLLNEFITLDKKSAIGLLSHEEQCNDIIAAHPTIQVKYYYDDDVRVTIIGFLNGLFGVREDGMGAICAEIYNNETIKFRLTS